jgi:hypothetical protein
VTILLWGVPEDPPMRAVQSWLAELGADVVLLDHAAVARTRVDFATSPEPGHTVSGEGGLWLLEAFSAAYLRPHDVRDYELTPRELARATLGHHLIYDWAEYADATIVNRPSADGSNHCKLSQAIEIGACGFLVPDSLLTNDAALIREFQAEHGRLIYKSVSSVRSVVKELDTNELPIGPMGPLLVQQRIDGVNVRVHVVGSRTFACAIESEAVDYRYARSRLAEVDLDEEVARRCVTLAQRLGLLVAGVDLIRTAAGDWYCLEVNPNPGFTFYDRSGEQVVARAVAELLLA